MGFLEVFKRFRRPVPETSFIAAQGRMTGGGPGGTGLMAGIAAQIVNGHQVVESAGGDVARCRLCGASLQDCRRAVPCDLRARS